MPVTGGGRKVWIIIEFEDCHPEEHEVGLPVLLVAGGVDDEIEAALEPVQACANKFQVREVLRIFAHGVPENHDGHVADKVSHAHRANGLSHAVIACGKLVAHVFTESTQKKTSVRFPQTYDWLKYLESRRYLEEFRTILHSPMLQQNIVKNGNNIPNV